MSIKVIRYRLPSYWACPLINDDYTGLTDEECEEIKRFLEKAEGYPVDVDWGTQGFTVVMTREHFLENVQILFFISVMISLMIL